MRSWSSRRASRIMSEYRGREAHRSRITRYPREAASNRTGRPASLLLEHSQRAIVLPNAAWAFVTGMEDRAAGRLEEPPWGGCGSYLRVD